VKVGIAANNRPARSHADGGAVAHLRTLRSSAVNLLKLRVVNLCPENLIDCTKVSTVPVCCQLNAMRQTFLQVRKEVVSASCMTLADEPARNEFGIGVERNPRPDIARAFRLVLARAVLFLRVNERPDFVTLDARAAEIAKRFVLILRAGSAKIAEKFINRVARHIRHSRDSAHGISLNQCSDDLHAFLSAQRVHAVNMLERSSIVK